MSNNYSNHKQPFFKLRDKRIILLDDDPYLPRLLLRNIGGIAKVEHYYTIEEVRVRLKVGTYDFFFIDHYMPDMDGIEFLKRLQKEGVKIPPVYFITALNIEIDRLCEEAGIEKPRAIIDKIHLIDDLHQYFSRK